MTEHIQEQTQQQQENLAHTIAKKNESWIHVGIRELMQTFGAGTKKQSKKDKNPHHISEDMENYEKRLTSKRMPISNN